MSADSRKKAKPKSKRGRPNIWKNTPEGAEAGSDQPQDIVQRVRIGNSNNHKVGHYEGPLREVIDTAREALSVYLLTEDAFPVDDVARNDERDGTESEHPRRAVKWKKRVDKFFNDALEMNEDALALGKLFIDLVSHSAEGVYTDPLPKITPAIRFAVCDILY